jgi:hypothetical protein
MTGIPPGRPDGTLCATATAQRRYFGVTARRLVGSPKQVANAEEIAAAALCSSRGRRNAWFDNPSLSVASNSRAQRDTPRSAPARSAVRCSARVLRVGG